MSLLEELFKSNREMARSHGRKEFFDPHITIGDINSKNDLDFDGDISADADVDAEVKDTSVGAAGGSGGDIKSKNKDKDLDESFDYDQNSEEDRDLADYLFHSLEHLFDDLADELDLNRGYMSQYSCVNDIIEDLVYIVKASRAANE